MSRAVPEWIGKTDDSSSSSPRVRVRMRDVQRFAGICYISGRTIRPGEAWDLDHIIPLINGGEHREFNLAPALKAPHREKNQRRRCREIQGLP